MELRDEYFQYTLLWNLWQHCSFINFTRRKLDTGLLNFTLVTEATNFFQATDEVTGCVKKCIRYVRIFHHSKCGTKVPGKSWKSWRGLWNRGLFAYFYSKVVWLNFCFFVSHSPLGAITLFMLLLRTWQVLCKNILPSCLKEKLWDTSSALLFQYCFTCLESDRGLPEGMCRTSPDTKRITEAAHYMPRWWRHHHIAMQRERWIPGPQALSCFKKF